MFLSAYCAFMLPVFQCLVYAFPWDFSHFSPVYFSSHMYQRIPENQLIPNNGTDASEILNLEALLLLLILRIEHGLLEMLENGLRQPSKHPDALRGNLYKPTGDSCIARS